MKLIPALKDYIWGGDKLNRIYGKGKVGEKVAESWELSAHLDGASVVTDGEFAGMTLSELFASRGELFFDAPKTDFPILIKLIDSAQSLSVQVHPNDDYARRHAGDNGKTEVWYVMDAEPGAGIYCGLKTPLTRAELEAKIADGSVEDALNFIEVKKGNAYLIEAGTLHAIGAGLLICEIQQSSNVTYRVYDYNRKGADGKPRALHVADALNVATLSAFQDNTKSGERTPTEYGSRRLITECAYFKVEEHTLLRPVSFSASLDSFTAVTVAEGEGEIICGGQTRNFLPGDTFLIPRTANFEIKGGGKLLMTTVPAQKYYIGIDLGGTNVKAGLCTEDGKIVVKSSIKTHRERPYQEIVADIAEQARALAAKGGVDFSEITAVGIGSPGSVDSATGTIVYSNNIRWDHVPLGSELEKLLAKPVFATNDANAAALGETKFGAGKRFGDTLLLTLGTGVGGGIVIGGKLFEGYKSAGAEVGHMVIIEDGEQCTCGRKGCLEAYGSATALIRDTKRAMKENPKSVLWEIAGTLERVDAATAFKGVRRGDKTAQEVVDAFIKHLGEGIANLINVLRPEAVIIGGGISNEGDALLVPLKAYVDSNIYGASEYAPVEIVIAELSNDAGLLGAASFAMSRLKT